MSIIRVNIWATLICIKPWITLDGFKYYICNVIIFIVMLMIQLSVILWILNIECSLLLLNWCIYKSLGNLYFRFPCDTGRVSRDLVLILEIEIPCCNIWMKWRKKKPVLDCFWPERAWFPRLRFAVFLVEGSLHSSLLGLGFLVYVVDSFYRSSALTPALLWAHLSSFLG